VEDLLVAFPSLDRNMINIAIDFDESKLSNLEVTMTHKSM